MDASDPKISDKIKIVDDILEEIWATQDKIYVFNKIDLLTQEELNILKETYHDLESVVYVSAFNKTWFDKLTDVILKNSLIKGSFYILNILSNIQCIFPANVLCLSFIKSCISALFTLSEFWFLMNKVVLFMFLKKLFSFFL